jgi:hypothetical protein
MGMRLFINIPDIVRKCFDGFCTGPKNRECQDNVVTDLPVCQSLDVNAKVGPFPGSATVQSFRWHECNPPKQSSANRLKAYSTTW